MKNYIALLIFLLTTINLSSQKVFKKGYFINNNDEKIECLIEGFFEAKNPTLFQYKLKENSSILDGKINDIKEFSIPNKFKFKRFEVVLDKSSSQLDKLSNSRKSILVKETLFLEYVVEGKISLLKYRNKDFERFFYIEINRNKDSPTYLEYKKYSYDKRKVSENLNYQKQLKDAFNCIIKNKIRYARKELTKFFIMLNNCVKSENIIKYDKISRAFKNAFNLSLRASIVSNKFSASSNSQKEDVNSNFLSQTASLELEYFYSSRNNFSLITELNYFNYANNELKEGILNNNLTFNENLNINNSGLSFGLGLRYYFFEKNINHSLFFDSNVIFDFLQFNNSIKFRGSYNIDQGYKGINFGVGYKFKQKYGIQFRFSNIRLPLEVSSSPFSNANNREEFKINSFNFTFIYTIL